MAFNEVKAFMVKEYDSADRQTEVQRRLDRLDMRIFMTDNDIVDEGIGLNKICAYIGKLNPQCLQIYRNETYKLKVLSSAVASYEWAKIPRTNEISGNHNFQTFKTALAHSITLHKESILAGDMIHKDPTTLTLFGQYGQRPNNRGNNHRQFNRFNNNRSTNHLRNNTSSRFPHPQQTRNSSTSTPTRSKICYRCGSSPWSPSHRCSPGSIKNYINSRLKKGERSVYILADVINGCESDTNDLATDDHDNLNTNYLSDDEVDIFNTQLTITEDTEFPEIDNMGADNALDQTIIESQLSNTLFASSSSYTHTLLSNNCTSPLKSNQTTSTLIDCNSIDIHNTSSYLNDAFIPEFCVDSGAPRSVIGLSSLKKIDKYFNIKSQLTSSAFSFRFGDEVFPSLGTVRFMLTTPPTIPNINVDLAVVNVDIPPLIGLNVLDSQKLMIDNVNNKLARRQEFKRNDSIYYLEDWFVPLHRSSSSHLHTPLNPIDELSVNFSKGELRRLHRQFFHPSPTKLFNLLRRTHPSDADPQTLKILNEITATCDPCQRVSSAPLRFRASFGSDSARFNERIFIDIFYIIIKKCKHTILHIIDEGTHFSAAFRLKNMETKSVWHGIIRCWTTIYTGLPNRIIVDQGSNLGNSFIRLAALDGITVEKTGIEAHNGLSICERYHDPIRSTVRKLLLDHPKADFELLLALAVKALNDTAGPDGIVPSALLFGEFPRLVMPSEYGRRLTSDERGEIALIARKEMKIHMDKMRISRAMKHNVPSATDMVYDPGDQVLIWREKGHSDKNGEYLGPYEVSSSDRQTKLVHVFDRPGAEPRPFSIAQVKPYRSPSSLSRAFFGDLKHSLGTYASPSISDDVFLTEIIPQKDPRSSTPEMLKARKQEIDNLMRRGTFKVVLREDIPPNANVLPGRFVLALKSTIDGSIFHKARFVIGGHRDKLKSFMVHSSQTLQPSSIRLLLALASIYGFNVWTSDVTQAYLQSAIPLARDLFLDSSVPELELSPDQCLKILQPLYGLSESGDLWYHTLQQHHVNDLQMKQLDSDSSFNFIHRHSKLSGLSGTYVDDLLRAGDTSFQQLSLKTERRFEMKPSTSLPCDFSGFRLQFNNNSSMIQTQQHYLAKLEPLQNDASFTAFRSMRMKLAWLSHTRPDCLFEISRLAQITESTYTNSPSTFITHLNKATKYANRHNVHITFPTLDISTLKVCGYSDASFGNNLDLSSQLGYIVFLSDDANNVIPITFKSYKAKRLCRSAMAAEVIAFSDLFDSAYTLSSELSVLTKQDIHLDLFPDSKCLFDIISKGSRTSEKRLMLDVAALREGFKRQDISNIGLVKSEANIADGLTKPMTQAALRSFLETSSHTPQPVQWIVRHEHDTA